jgi:hypothetical protein
MSDPNGHDPFFGDAPSPGYQPDANAQPLAPGGDPNPEQFRRWLEDLKQARPAAYEAVKRAMQYGDKTPGVGFPQRWVDSKHARHVWPTVAIGPDREVFPGQVTTERTLHMLDDDTTVVQGSIRFAEWTTVVSVTSICHVVNTDPAVDVWGRDLVQVQFAREDRDNLTPVIDAPGAGAAHLVPLSNITGSGERPHFIAGFGWPFRKDEVLTVNGAAAFADWEVWITFQCIDFPPITNLGIMPTEPYGRQKG